MYIPSSSISISIVVFIFLSRMVACGSLPPATIVDQPGTSLPINNQGSVNVIPNGWKKIDADGKFSFYLPPDMRDTGVSGMENYHKEYTNGKLHLSFDYDPYGILAYENRTRLGKNFQERTLQVDGRNSFLFFYQTTGVRNRTFHYADLSVGDLPNGDVKLRMWIESRNAANLKVAETIFRTIQFSR